MPASVADFVKAAEDSGIITDEALVEYLRGVAPESDATPLANRLVKDGRITAFQAKHIYGGRAKALVLGPYVVLDVLGKGGMGYVYKAEHRKMRRVVALKVIAKTALKSTAAVRRFEREVQAAARLEHPNIVTAFDAGEAAGTHYLVMQFVDGKNLSEMVKASGPQPVARAVDWVLQAARGLAFAHEQGVIHRDIKPANLLVDSRGAVKILDMGLARLETLDADQDQLTGTGQIMGTVDYMAPEQAMDTRQADARSDIYSLGVTLWYLLTGRPLFEADSVLKKIMAHQHEPARSLADVRVSSDARLEAVFQRMVAKQPDARFQSMQEVVAALEALPLDEMSQGPSSGDVGGGAATRGPLCTDATQALEVHKPSAGNEDTARLSAVEIDTNPVVQSRKAGGDGQLTSRRLRPTPLQLALAGGAVATVVVMLAGFVFAVRGRRTTPVSPTAVAIEVDPAGPGEPVSAVDLTAAADGDWRTLWAAHGPPDWRLDAGVLLHAGKGRGWIGTRQRYGDFQIELEYRLPPKGNTGVFLRAWPEGNPSGADFVEVQLVDDVAFQTTGLNCTGSLFKRSEPSPRPETRLDDWNTAVVRVVGKQVTVTVNGKTCINADVDFPRDMGVIGLQLLESPVEFRRVRVQDLGGNEAEQRGGEPKP